MNIPNRIREKVQKYAELYGEKPQGWNYREENLNNYEKRLDELIKKKFIGSITNFDKFCKR